MILESRKFVYFVIGTRLIGLLAGVVFGIAWIPAALSLTMWAETIGLWQSFRDQKSTMMHQDHFNERTATQLPPAFRVAIQLLYAIVFTIMTILEPVP